MIDLNVLITTHHQAFMHRGGGEIEMREVATNLSRLGVKTDIYGPSSRPLEAYDTVLHFSVHGGGLQIAEAVKGAGKRLVLWPNLWWTDKPTREQAALVERFFAIADGIVFKSKAEQGNVARFVKLDAEKALIVPWGVDPCYEIPADPNMFKTIYRLNEYILWVGIIEERKNQLAAVEALKSGRLPVVFVGDYRDRAYYEACVRASPPHFKFLPHMPAKSEILRSAIQNCRIYLEAPLEPAGLSAFEAGLASRPLVLSDDAWSREQFGEHAVLVDPRSPESIREGVEHALAESQEQQLASLIRTKNSLPQCLNPLVRALDVGTENVHTLQRPQMRQSG